MWSRPTPPCVLCYLAHPAPAGWVCSSPDNLGEMSEMLEDPYSLDGTCQSFGYKTVRFA